MVLVLERHILINSLFLSFYRDHFFYWFIALMLHSNISHQCLRHCVWFFIWFVFYSLKRWLEKKKHFIGIVRVTDISARTNVVHNAMKNRTSQKRYNFVHYIAAFVWFATISLYLRHSKFISLLPTCDPHSSSTFLFAIFHFTSHSIAAH